MTRVNEGRRKERNKLLLSFTHDAVVTVVYPSSHTTIAVWAIGLQLFHTRLFQMQLWVWMDTPTPTHTHTPQQSLTYDRGCSECWWWASVFCPGAVYSSVGTSHTPACITTTHTHTTPVHSPLNYCPPLQMWHNIITHCTHHVHCVRHVSNTAC